MGTTNIDELLSLGVKKKDLNNPAVIRVIKVLIRGDMPMYELKDKWMQQADVPKHKGRWSFGNKPRVAGRAILRKGLSNDETIASIRVQRAANNIMKNLTPKERLDVESAITDNAVLMKLAAHGLTDNAGLSKKEKLQTMAIKAKLKMLEFRGGVMKPSEVALLLDVERQTVNDKRKRKELLGIKGSVGYKYPVWQFDNGKIIRNLKDVLMALSKDNDQWMQLRFFISDNDYLLSNLPKYPNAIDALKLGYYEDVLKAVSVYFKHGTV